MQTLRRLYQYNLWANERVLGFCHGLDPAGLGDEAAGTIGTIDSTVGHFIGVEDFYLALLRGDDPAAAFGSREAYFAHDLAWFTERSAIAGNGYLAMLAERDAAFLESELRVPWLDVPLTARDGLLQVLAHSAQHRAQILSVLGGRGVDVPDIDYVFMLSEAHRPGTH